MKKLDPEFEEVLRQNMRLLWAQACVWEGVHPSQRFVVFSSDNPYSGAYDEAFKQWEWIKSKEASHGNSIQG